MPAWARTTLKRWPVHGAVPAAAGFGNFFCHGAVRGPIGQRGRRGGEPLAVGEHEIVGRLALLDIGMQRQRAVARSVEAGLLLAVARAGSHRAEGQRTAGRRPLFAFSAGCFVAAKAPTAIMPSASPAHAEIVRLILSLPDCRDVSL